MVTPISIKVISAAKQRLLAEMCAEQKCDVLCIQETHWGQKAERTRMRGMRLVAEIPHEQYGSAVFVRSDYVYDSTSASTTNNVEIIQAQLNNLMRSVLRIHDRIIFKVLLLTHKAVNNTAPEYLCDLIRLNVKSTTIRTRASFDPCLLCVPPISKTCANSFFDRSFVYAAPTLWNALDLDIRLLPFDAFKKRVKTHLYLKYFAN